MPLTVTKYLPVTMREQNYLSLFYNEMRRHLLKDWPATIALLDGLRKSDLQERKTLLILGYTSISLFIYFSDWRSHKGRVSVRASLIYILETIGTNALWLTRAPGDEDATWVLPCCIFILG